MHHILFWRTASSSSAAALIYCSFPVLPVFRLFAWYPEIRYVSDLGPHMNLIQIWLEKILFVCPNSPGMITLRQRNPIWVTSAGYYGHGITLPCDTARAAVWKDAAAWFHVSEGARVKIHPPWLLAIGRWWGITGWPNREEKWGGNKLIPAVLTLYKEHIGPHIHLKNVHADSDSESNHAQRFTWLLFFYLRNY